MLTLEACNNNNKKRSLRKKKKKEAVICGFYCKAHVFRLLLFTDACNDLDTDNKL